MIKSEVCAARAPVYVIHYSPAKVCTHPPGEILNTKNPHVIALKCRSDFGLLPTSNEILDIPIEAVKMSGIPAISTRSLSKKSP